MFLGESRTFVPISWMCMKQTGVSHSSTESKVKSLDCEQTCDVTFWPDNLGCVRECSAKSSRGNRKNELDAARITAHCNPRPRHLCPCP